MSQLSIHQRVLTFLSLMTGPTPSQCEETGLDREDSFHPMITEIFTSGCCGNLAMMLHLSFGGEIYKCTDICHIVTTIDGRFYDITGDVTDKYNHVVPITVEELYDNDFINNYSMELRGPML